MLLYIVFTPSSSSLSHLFKRLMQVWTEREGVRNLLNVVGKEVRLEGFLVRTYLDRFSEFGMQMEDYIKQGKLSSKHKIYNGIESFLEGIGSLFSSSNIGKVVIQVSP